MELNIDNCEEKKNNKGLKKDKRKYNKEYYQKVRKPLHKITRCKYYSKEYVADKTIMKIVLKKRCIHSSYKNFAKKSENVVGPKKSAQ
jgi:hypothetical protein